EPGGLRDVAARGEQQLRQIIIADPIERVCCRRSPMPPSVLLALALRILSETGLSVRNPVQIVAPGDFPAIESRIAPLRAFRRRIDGVLDPVIYVLRTTDTFERAASGHAPSAVLVAGSLFHELIHGADEALDESHVLAREATTLQEYVIQHLLDLSVVDRRFLERHIDQLRARAQGIVSSF